MEQEKRAVTIELSEPEYWALVVLAGLQTQTIEEYAKECMDSAFESTVEKDPALGKKLLGIFELLR